MKKGKITAVESSCLKGMIADGISVETMCSQLDRSSVVVEKEVNRIKEESVREQLFINKTASGSKGVSIMTEAASVQVDVSKDKSIPSDNRSTWIHKIRSDG